jgi:GNAT superfamily N-acetyltransferase
MSLDIRPYRPELRDDLEVLWSHDATAAACWCMWFIDSVKAFHAAGADGNRRQFDALAAGSPQPMGLLAYRDGQAVGWCAVGPKARFARAVKTPTLRGAGPAGLNDWFVPCFYVRPDARRSGITQALLAEAVALAQAHGAVRVEGFPAAGARPATSGDRQVGTEAVFACQGFGVVSRPSAQRVVMRRDLRDPPGR